MNKHGHVVVVTLGLIGLLSAPKVSALDSRFDISDQGGDDQPSTISLPQELMVQVFKTSASTATATFSSDSPTRVMQFNNVALTIDCGDNNIAATPWGLSFALQPRESRTVSVVCSSGGGTSGARLAFEMPMFSPSSPNVPYPIFSQSTLSIFDVADRAVDGIPTTVALGALTITAALGTSKNAVFRFINETTQVLTVAGDQLYADAQWRYPMRPVIYCAILDGSGTITSYTGAYASPQQVGSFDLAPGASLTLTAFCPRGSVPFSASVGKLQWDYRDVVVGAFR